MNSILSFISNRRASLLALLSLTLLPFVFFLPATLGRSTLGDQDAIFYFLPSYKLVVEQVRSLQLPLWNPNVYSGMPLFAAWQPGVLDPLNWLYLALGVTGRTLSLVQQLSFCLALASTFIYAREIGLLRRAAFVSALIYAFGGYLVARTLYPGLLHVASLMPLVLFFIERVSVRASRRMIVAGSFVIAWQLFAGHPQPFVYSALLGLFYSIYRGSFRALRSTLVMFAMGAGLACVQWLPAWEFAQQSVRSEWSYEMFTQHSLHPASLLVSLIPYFHGQGRGIYQMPYWGAYWHHLEAQVYLGGLAISLAIAGGVRGWRLKFRPAMFWSIAGAVAVLLAFGKYFPPLAYVIYQLPVIGNFRSPNRYWMIVALACAVLAGYAVDALLRSDQKDVSRIVGRIAIGASILITVIVSGICFYILFVARWDLADAEFKVPVLSAAVSSLVLWFFVRSKSRARLWPILALLLIVDFGLYASYAPIWSGTKPEDIAQSNHPELGRDTGTGDARSHIQLSVESGEFDPLRFYGIEMATGYDPLINARYKEFSGIDEAGHSHLKTLLSVNDRTLDVLSVRHVIGDPRFCR